MAIILKINVTNEAADHYPGFVSERLATLYSAEVDCSVDGVTQVSLYGFDLPNSDLEQEISFLVKKLWDDFCNHGWKALRPVGKSHD